ncbi:hypothetical protein ACOMHN_044817 [Nucella lapillus]
MISGSAIGSLLFLFIIAVLLLLILCRRKPTPCCKKAQEGTGPFPNFDREIHYIDVPPFVNWGFYGIYGEPTKIEANMNHLTYQPSLGHMDCIDDVIA